MTQASPHLIDKTVGSSPGPHSTPSQSTSDSLGTPDLQHSCRCYALRVGVYGSSEPPHASFTATVCRKLWSMTAGLLIFNFVQRDTLPGILQWTAPGRRASVGRSLGERHPHRHRCEPSWLPHHRRREIVLMSCTRGYLLEFVLHYEGV